MTWSVCFTTANPIIIFPCKMLLAWGSPFKQGSQAFSVVMTADRITHMQGAVSVLCLVDIKWQAQRVMKSAFNTAVG